MGRGRAADVLDVLLSAGIVWYSLPADVRRQIHAWAWQYTARQSARVAAGVGRFAITAERRYWETVRP